MEKKISDLTDRELMVELMSAEQHIMNFQRLLQELKDEFKKRVEESISQPSQP